MTEFRFLTSNAKNALEAAEALRRKGQITEGAQLAASALGRDKKELWLPSVNRLTLATDEEMQITGGLVETFVKANVEIANQTWNPRITLAHLEHAHEVQKAIVGNLRLWKKLSSLKIDHDKKPHDFWIEAVMNEVSILKSAATLYDKTRANWLRNHGADELKRVGVRLGPLHPLKTQVEQEREGLLQASGADASFSGWRSIGFAISTPLLTSAARRTSLYRSMKDSSLAVVV